MYEPALPDRPQPESFEEAVGQIIADALGFAIGKMLAVILVLMITLVIILVWLGWRYRSCWHHFLAS